MENSNPSDKGTTIWIPLELKERLDAKKQNRYEPYYSVIERYLSEGESNGRLGFITKKIKSQ